MLGEQLRCPRDLYRVDSDPSFFTGELARARVEASNCTATNSVQHLFLAGRCVHMRLQCDYLFYHFRAIFSILFFFVNERTGAAPTLFLADGYWCVDRTCLCTQQSDMTILDDCTCKRIWCECFDFSLSLSLPPPLALFLCYSCTSITEM